jgi:hypothetical protein
MGGTNPEVRFASEVKPLTAVRACLRLQQHGDFTALRMTLKRPELQPFKAQIILKWTAGQMA